MIEHDADDVLNQLRDELGRVSAPPEFAARVQQRIGAGADQPVDLLAEELGAVAVSPEFKVRVRQQVEAAEQGRAGSWLLGWRWLAPVAAAASVAIVAAMLWRGSKDVPTPITTTAASAPITTTPDTTPTTAAPSTDIRRVTATREANRTASATAASLTTEPSMEVITNQPEILKAMWARAGQPGFADTIAPAEPVGQQDVLIESVNVQPVVVKWLVEPPELPSLLPLFWRVAAELAERSTK